MHELSASVAKAKLQAALRELAVSARAARGCTQQYDTLTPHHCVCEHMQLVKETNAQLTTKMMSTNANKSSLQVDCCTTCLACTSDKEPHSFFVTIVCTPPQRRVEELRGVVSVSQDMEQESAARIRELERALKEAESKINNSTRYPKHNVPTSHTHPHTHTHPHQHRVHESQLWEETQRAKAAATAAAAAHSAQLEAERKRAEEMRDSIVRAGKAREAQLEAQAAEREEALKAQHRYEHTPHYPAPLQANPTPQPTLPQCGLCQVLARPHAGPCKCTRGGGEAPGSAAQGNVVACGALGGAAEAS